ncbi:calmodulin-binding receptor-like cytoplasmic kinase 2 [Silene latifolia]|uniref:calmodulin-binding receptor-like cytoplasmic kinase 2 n=1 Tax=Silene latifolia TaxID=37657 RepID=UPI003D77F828
MNRPLSPLYGSYSWNDTSSNSQHNLVGTKALKQQQDQQQNKKSFKDKFKAVVRKLSIGCTTFGPKSKDDVLEVEPYEVRRSSQINTNSSGYSSGSRKRGSSPYNPPRPFESPTPKRGEVYGTLDFSLEDIQKATKNFSEANIIGEGGFGTVFKGQLRDGTLVAVKRARKNLFDKRTIQEFRSEILAFSKIEHLNLVKFYGYLEHPAEKIIVVEYVGNGTLFEQLHGNQGYAFELGERLDIAIDVAHAVTYLHSYNDPPIIHRDIKASNVLITEKFRAKVADFGLARLVPDGDDVTHISTHIKGTIGYMDPEYMKTYQLTEKSDVYSFGVLLVELVTGRHPLEPHRTAKERITTPWALSKLRDGIPVLAMDPRLQRSPASIKVVEKILKLALECTRPLRQSRPSMKECVEALWVIRKEFKGSAKLGNFSSPRSVDLLEAETRKRRQHSSGNQGEIYPFMSA